MALVASIHMDIGWELPDLALAGTDGRQYRLRECVGENGLLVAFTCNHCPYAIAVWPRLIRHAGNFRAMGVSTVAINPNIHPDYPEDSPAAMREKVIEWKIDFPYLEDTTQEAASTFDAQCTPDLYLFAKDGKLYYHGRIDDYWKDEARAQQQELATAVEMMVAGDSPPQPQHPTIGCSIKWRQDSGLTGC